MTVSEPLASAEQCTELLAWCDPWAAPGRGPVSWATRVACTVVDRTRLWGVLGDLAAKVDAAVRAGELPAGVAAVEVLVVALEEGLAAGDAVAALTGLYTRAALRA